MADHSEKMNRGIMDAYGDLHNKQKFADYAENLASDALHRQLRSGNPSLKAMAEKGLVDHKTVVQVLIDRHKARGLTPITIPAGSGNLDLEKFEWYLRQGPIIDHAFDIGSDFKKYHGVYPHLMQLDYILPNIERQIGRANLAEFFAYLGTDRGVKLWIEMLDRFGETGGSVHDGLQDTRFLNDSFFGRDMLNLKDPHEYLLN